MGATVDGVAEAKSRKLRRVLGLLRTTTSRMHGTYEQRLNELDRTYEIVTRQHQLKVESCFVIPRRRNKQCVSYQLPGCCPRDVLFCVDAKNCFYFLPPRRAFASQNRNQLQLREGVSLKEAHDAEMDFFKSHAVFKTVSPCLYHEWPCTPPLRAQSLVCSEIGKPSERRVLSYHKSGLALRLNGQA